MEEDELRRRVTEVARAARDAGRRLAVTDTAKKNAVLARVAEALRAPASEAVLEANRRDVEKGEAAGLSAALLDRLRLDRARLDKVADAVDHIARLPDPVGQLERSRRLENGLEVGRMRVPLGLVSIIYESRPNVTVDAAALCFKAGNACLLRGGKEANESNHALAAVFSSALEAEGLPAASVSLLPSLDRAATRWMLELDELIDVVIPRGGEGLIRFVAEHSRVPVIRHYKGVCHVYLDELADPKMAREIALNAKVQRPGVCNAMETLLVDSACAETLLPDVAKALMDAGVELRGDARARKLVPAMHEAQDADWDEEYLDTICAVAVVDGLDGALAHVRAHGSKHTEAIITESYARAERWLREVDASCVLVNASTRFNDGGELGLGAEVGISTTKLHCYGPMGLEELCALKWVGRGAGQIRR